jgi:hypothetical protein
MVNLPNLFKYLPSLFKTFTSSTLYNYADDNTLAHADDNIDKVVEHLEKDSLALSHAISQSCISMLYLSDNKTKFPQDYTVQVPVAWNYQPPFFTFNKMSLLLHLFFLYLSCSIACDFLL